MKDLQGKSARTTKTAGQKDLSR